jgi:hypothetical protein
MEKWLMGKYRLARMSCPHVATCLVKGCVLSSARLTVFGKAM